jgi:NADH-quinone oxidoreductase subunit L
MDLAHLLPTLLGIAWLLPLASFVLIVFFGKHMGHHGKAASYLAAGAIMTSCLLSVVSLGFWLREHKLEDAHHSATETPAVHEAAVSTTPFKLVSTTLAQPVADEHGGEHEVKEKPAYFGDWYSLVEVGSLKITIGWYIDALTVAMFCMVTFIASCIHVYAIGYMHEELHDVTDHEVTLADGHHLHRPGRFHRFFQYLSLFCFSMLGIVIAGNIAMVFVFWELVGICSYFLIGFYYERKSASNAANKAFIVNRVGDFGFIIGLMALFGALGTFSFGGDTGLFEAIRPTANHHLITVPSGMTYGLLVLAGLGIFCGCVGKSAQFPLQVWLPDAMEGPTPVSALVHSATMVAAGVYLVGRCYPLFTQEVLLVIAYIGCITLFIAATIAIVAVDIKRVLAYSTVSQLGYMMLALGVGGWTAGLFHLFTHAFFKSLLFMCSGSVIHACHTNDMRKMGGLLKKMPFTGYTMLVGCLAIIGTGIPFVGGFSGYYSKDSIIAQTLSFTNQNPAHRLLFFAAAGGASLTAFYMFRLWYLTFIGKPRDHHVYEHAHESPKVMYVPLVILAVFAFGIGFPLVGLTNVLEQARPSGTSETAAGALIWAGVTHPAEHLSHEGAIHVSASLIAFSTALAGFLLATVFYAWRFLRADEVQRQFSKIYTFLWHKWYFDELYNAIFVQPVLFISRRVSDFDRTVIDRIVNGSAVAVRGVATLDDKFDRLFVDGLVNWLAGLTYSVGISLRQLQTGRLRTYVMFIALGTVLLFVILGFLHGAWAG